MTPWRLEWLRLVRTHRWMIVAGVASLASTPGQSWPRSCARGSRGHGPCSSRAAVFAALGILLALPILGLVPVVQPWLPSQLLSAVATSFGGHLRRGDCRAARARDATLRPPGALTPTRVQWPPLPGPSALRDEGGGAETGVSRPVPGTRRGAHRRQS